MVPTGEVEFEDHDIAGSEDRRDRVRRRVDIIEVGRSVVVERGRDGDHKRIGRLRLRRGAQLAQRRRGAQQHVEIGLGEIGLPGIDRVDHPRVDVDADHLDAAARQGRRGRQADIAETDDTHRLDRVLHRSAPECESVARSAITADRD